MDKLGHEVSVWEQERNAIGAKVRIEEIEHKLVNIMLVSYENRLPVNPAAHARNS